MVSYDEWVKKNDLTSDKPIIAYCPDWRFKDGRPVYIKFIFEFFAGLIESRGCKMHLMSFDERVDDIKDKIDGWIIPGGRDIDPKFYGQENTASKVEAEDSEKRWNFCRHFIDNCNPQMPILGICYGMQAINCLFGGDLIQDLENGYKNHFRKRKMIVEPDSRLAEALQGTPLIGNCYHHQGIGKVPDCLRVTCVDEKDGYPHCIEYKGDDRNIIAVLWHPESSFTDTRMDELDRANVLIIDYFFKNCREFHTQKTGTIKTS